MPELAEVEYFRRRWDAGLGCPILGVAMQADKRVFRGNNLETLRRILSGATLVSSQARGKQILFRFSKRGWLGVHLGMTGELRQELPDFAPGKHDHLVLFQRGRALVFRDPRQFGRLLFHHGDMEPEWWSSQPPAVTSDAFTFERMRAFLQRHARAPIKAVLLLQQGFPGVGNWMADEILWRAKIHPRRRAGRLAEKEAKSLWRSIRFVCQGALKTVAKDYSEPPPSWLFRHRWEKGGRCPRDGAVLGRGTVGGRTTVWCPVCQSQRSRPAR